MQSLLRITVPWLTPWAVLTAALAAQGTVVDLGTLGGPLGSANDVSADGAVIVGSTTRADESTAAFYWTAAGGFVDLLPPVGVAPRPSEATLISADGSVVIGTWSFGSNRYAFRWSQANGAERLGSLSPNRAVFPRAVSADGEVIVGEALTASNQSRAFRWTRATGIVDLGTLGGWASVATDVSEDGNVVVGRSFTASGRSRAFLWTSQTGLVDLGTLSGLDSNATAVNADGSVIVGAATDATNAYRAFRWTSAGGMQDLGTLGGTASFAVDVSDDGSVVVGNATFGPSSAKHAFRWTATTGMTDLGTFGGLQSFANAVSGDGRVVIGSASASASLAQRAFRWSASTGLVELGTLGGPNTTPAAISFSGDIIVGRSTTPTGTRAFRHEEGVRAAIGERYCASTPPNSTGQRGRIEVLGSNALSARDVSLTASALPTQSFGFFLVSTTQDLVPGVGGGLGTLCLGGAIGRFVGPGQVQSTGAMGSFSLVIDAFALPQPTGPVAALSSETWNFQAWHRDIATTGATSNLTDAVAVTFQ